MDLVSRAGNSASGDFAHTLNVTDIHKYLDGIAGGIGRGEEAVQRALNEIAGVLPLALRGVDSDSGSEFINWRLTTLGTTGENAILTSPCKQAIMGAPSFALGSPRTFGVITASAAAYNPRQMEFGLRFHSNFREPCMARR